MPTVRIEHVVPNYAVWKQVFDSDPVGREKVGVRRYHVSRDVADPNIVMIDLDFDKREDADAFLATMQGIWTQVQGKLIFEPRARIVETVETKLY
jgi:hypothetical protein